VSQEPPTRAAPAPGSPDFVAEPPLVFPADGASADGASADGASADGVVGASHGGPPDGEVPDAADGAPPRRRRTRRWLVEWAVIILVAVGVAFGVRTFVAQTYFVPSTSMWPTLKAGDRIVVSKIYGAIEPGDIIVFKRPPAEHCGGPPVPDLVKRVIGLPGQTVSAHGGKVYITGRLQKEPWLPKGTQTFTTMTHPFKVPKGDYFVMGDNRVNSCDSRTWGPVKASYVVGKVFLILWPPSQLRFF
jgi:signal peptidase I